MHQHPAAGAASAAATKRMGIRIFRRRQEGTERLQLLRGFNLFSKRSDGMGDAKGIAMVTRTKNLNASQRGKSEINTGLKYLC